MIILSVYIFNRPGVAGAVLQTASSLIHSVILFLQTFKTSLHPKCESLGAEILRECSPPQTCHMSLVTCHVSRVTCHMSCVTCHFFSSFFGQSGEAYWWRVCYQRGLPRLVFTYTVYLSYYQMYPYE